MATQESSVIALVAATGAALVWANSPWSSSSCTPATEAKPLGERVHRNWPLHDLRPHADDVLAAVAARIDPLALNRSLP